MSTIGEAPETTHRPIRQGRLRTAWATVGAALAIAVGAVGPALVADGADEPRSVLTPTTPCRLLDLRPGSQVGPRATPLGAGETLTVQAQGAQGECSAAQLPANAVGLQLNVTALNATDRSFITIWPDGPLPNASSLNPWPGQPPIPNGITTQLAGGGFKIYNSLGEVNLVVDVVGYYTDENERTRTETISIPAAALSLSVFGPATDVGSRGVQWENNAVGGATVTLARPPEWTGDTPVIVRVTFVRTTDAFGNVSFFTRPDSQNDGDDFDTGVGVTGSVSVAGGADVRRTIDIVPADRLDDGPWWKFGLQRDTSIANPYPGDVYVEAVSITYDADV